MSELTAVSLFAGAVPVFDWVIGRLVAVDGR